MQNHVDRIRQDYYADLKSKLMADRQRATAMYFIDRLALRAGNEKGDDEADTVGCCSLRCEHVTLLPPNKLVFDFLGKDSIRYYNEVTVDDRVYKNIRIFKENKEDDDELFDRVNVRVLLLSPSRVVVLTSEGAVADRRVEPSFGFVHEGAYCEGLPYIQRVVDVPRSARSWHAREGHCPGEAERV